MRTNSVAPDYKGYRFPPEIISHAVWLSFRFSLSFRDVEELLVQRGIVVTYETVRQWCLTFGQTYANEVRRRRPCCGDKWYMDEVFLTIRDKRHSLWRAVDQDGNVLDILVQSRRNKKAAKRFFRKLLKGLQYVPWVIITDKLKNYGAAKREILPGVEHRRHKELNNRAENSHQPTRLREKKCGASNQPSRPNTWTHCWAFSAAQAPLVHQGIPCHFTRQIPGVERDSRSKTHRITINPLQYFNVFGVSSFYSSAVICAPTSKLTTSS